MFFFRDLNPLHQLTDQTDYQDKYYNKIMSIYHKYAEVTTRIHQITQLQVNLMLRYK